MAATTHGDGPGEHDAVLDRLTRALAEVRRDRVGGITDERDGAAAPRRGRRPVGDGPPMDGVVRGRREERLDGAGPASEPARRVIVRPPTRGAGGGPQTAAAQYVSPPPMGKAKNRCPGPSTSRKMPSAVSSVVSGAIPKYCQYPASRGGRAWPSSWRARSTGSRRRRPPRRRVPCCHRRAARPRRRPVGGTRRSSHRGAACRCDGLHQCGLEVRPAHADRRRTDRVADLGDGPAGQRRPWGCATRRCRARSRRHATSSARPSSARARIALFQRMNAPPDSMTRGSAWRSRTTASMPARCSATAVARPPTPAPTMTAPGAVARTCPSGAGVIDAPGRGQPVAR